MGLRAAQGWLVWALIGALWGCADGVANGEAPRAAAPAASSGPATSVVHPRAAERARMVERQIAARGVKDPRVLAAMRSVPRHLFVPDSERSLAYADEPLPIGHEQTISQPYIVALMTELAGVGPGAKVLEVGTGSGYQAAVLAAMGAKVWSIEIVGPLAQQASRALAALGYAVQVRHGDGYRGWPEVAPFDAILVTAAPPRIPEPLLAQLALGGRIVVPVGVGSQDLLVITRTERGFERRNVLPVLFVPMTGEAQGAPR